MELEKLRQIIAEVLSVDPREVTRETTFAEDLCADSLDIYQIIEEIEEVFDIEIAPEAVENVATVGDAVELIKNVKNA